MEYTSAGGASTSSTPRTVCMPLKTPRNSTTTEGGACGETDAVTAAAAAAGGCSCGWEGAGGPRARGAGRGPAAGGGPARVAATRALRWRGRRAAAAAAPRRCCRRAPAGAGRRPACSMVGCRRGGTDCKPAGRQTTGWRGDRGGGAGQTVPGLPAGGLAIARLVAYRSVTPKQVRGLLCRAA